MLAHIDDREAENDIPSLAGTGYHPVLAGLGLLPVLYLTLVDGKGHRNHGGIVFDRCTATHCGSSAVRFR